MRERRIWEHEGSLEALAHHVSRRGEGVYLVEEVDDGQRFGAGFVKMERNFASLWPQNLLRISRPRELPRSGPRFRGRRPSLEKFLPIPGGP